MGPARLLRSAGAAKSFQIEFRDRKERRKPSSSNFAFDRNGETLLDRFLRSRGTAKRFRIDFFVR
jgi:hypothetical protein